MSGAIRGSICGGCFCSVREFLLWRPSTVPDVKYARLSVVSSSPLTYNLYMVAFNSQRQRLDRITVDSDVMGGRPCIRGMRFPVSRLLALLASGESEESILANHPDLEVADIRQAMAYAALVTDEQVVFTPSP